MSSKYAFKKFFGYGVGVAFGSTALFYVSKMKADASWTNNHTPEVPWDWNWDKREPSSLEKESKSLESTGEPEKKPRKTRATRHLIFIRHGQYNLEGPTDKEKYLTPLGREQAALTGQRLKELDFPITRFVHSTMTRAAETAQIIMKTVGVEEAETCDLLREGAPVPPEPPTGHWKPEYHQFHTDGARIEAAFRQYFHRAPPEQTETSYEVYVCHANVIRYFICRALQLPPEAWLRFSIHNGSMTRFSIRSNGNVSIRSIGDAGYMDPSKLTVN